MYLRARWGFTQKAYGKTGKVLENMVAKAKENMVEQPTTTSTDPFAELTNRAGLEVPALDAVSGIQGVHDGVRDVHMNRLARHLDPLAAEMTAAHEMALTVGLTQRIGLHLRSSACVYHGVRASAELGLLDSLEARQPAMTAQSHRVGMVDANSRGGLTPTQMTSSEIWRALGIEDPSQEFEGNLIAAAAYGNRGNYQNPPDRESLAPDSSVLRMLARWSREAVDAALN